MNESKYLYADQVADVESAAGVKGDLIRDVNGSVMFRVYQDSDHFTDYEIRHDNLESRLMRAS